MQLIDKIEDIDIDALSEELFDEKSSVKIAEEIFNDLQEQNVIIRGSFNDNEWGLRNRVEDDTQLIIDFKVIDALLIIPFKCWIVEQLEEFRTATVKMWNLYLSEAINLTSAFSKGLESNLVDYIKDLDVSNVSKVNRINAICNFIEYALVPTYSSYNKALIKLKSKLRVKGNIRELPKSSEVMTFSWYLESFFQNEQNQNRKILYFPLLIWWKLTNVIPLRSGEFSTIERNCLSEKDSHYFIKLPRSKNKNYRIQIVDKLQISADLFELIQEYIDLTEKFGRSDTLLSYRSIYAVKEDLFGNSFPYKRNFNRFNRAIFSRLLQHFYKNVIYPQLGYKIRELRPNDTRHFAFMSLMLQGISPIEIARLGGHSTIDAQYHYQQHKEYLIDSEVHQLMLNFRHQKESQEKEQLENKIPEELQLISQSRPFSKSRLPLDIGYCTDEQQRCESEECMLCSKWWISPNDLLEKKVLVIEKINQRKNKISELFTFMNHLHRKLGLSTVPDMDPNSLNELKTMSNQIYEQLNQVARLEENIRRFR